MEGPKIYSIPVPPSDINKDFGKILESGKGSDVSFEVDSEVFAAHKLVLAARSPVFRAQLFGPLKDKNTHRIKVEDMEAPVFKVLYSTSLYIVYIHIVYSRTHTCLHIVRVICVVFPIFTFSFSI